MSVATVTFCGQREIKIKYIYVHCDYITQTNKYDAILICILELNPTNESQVEPFY